MDPDLRTALLIVGLLFCALFAGMTISVVAESGLDILSITALGIVGLVLLGLIGALREPPGR